MRYFYKIVRSGVRVLLFSNLFIAICAIALVEASYLSLYPILQTVPVTVVTVVFFSVLFIYNYNVIFQGEFVVNSARKLWMSYHRKGLTFLSILSLLISLISSLFLSVSSIVLLVHLFAIAIMYGLPFRLFNNKVALRRIPLLKPFLIAYVWSITTVLLPVFENSGALFSEKVLWLLLQRFLFILALVLPFDIRDHAVDRNENILTIPLLLGVERTKILICLLFAVNLIISLFLQSGWVVIGSKFFSYLVAMVIIVKVEEAKDDYYYTLGVDGIMLLYCVCMAILFQFIHFVETFELESVLNIFFEKIVYLNIQ